MNTIIRQRDTRVMPTTTYRELKEGDTFLMQVRTGGSVASKVGIKVGKVDGDWAFLDVSAGFLSSIDPDCKVRRVDAELVIGEQ